MGKAGEVQDRRRCKANALWALLSGLMALPSRVASEALMILAVSIIVPVPVPVIVAISRPAAIGSAFRSERGLRTPGFCAQASQHIRNHRIPGDPHTLLAQKLAGSVTVAKMPGPTHQLTGINGVHIQHVFDRCTDPNLLPNLSRLLGSLRARH